MNKEHPYGLLDGNNSGMHNEEDEDSIFEHPYGLLDAQADDGMNEGLETDNNSHFVKMSALWN